MVDNNENDDEVILTLYGAWLGDYNFKGISKKLRDLTPKKIQLFDKRCNDINALADAHVADVKEAYENLKVGVNYANILTAVGKYVNDVYHYKIWDEIDSAINCSKMLAHMLKWLSIYPAVSVIIDYDELKSLNEETQAYVLNLNSIFLMDVLRYIIENFTGVSDTINLVTKYISVIDLIESGDYEVKTAVKIFRELYESVH
jgi:hypothetical protein